MCFVLDSPDAALSHGEHGHGIISLQSGPSHTVVPFLKARLLIGNAMYVWQGQCIREQQSAYAASEFQTNVDSYLDSVVHAGINHRGCTAQSMKRHDDLRYCRGTDLEGHQTAASVCPV